MKTSNSYTSQVLTLAVSISIVFCSASLLVFTISNTSLAKAENEKIFEETGHAAPWDGELRGAAGLGIVNDTAYFVVWANPNTLYKAGIRTAKDWYQK